MKIRVLATPAGEAPVELREQWVGVVLPVDHSMIPILQWEETHGGGARGTETLERVPANGPNHDGYPVLFSDCMTALRANGLDDAADKWEKRKKEKHWPAFLT